MARLITQLFLILAIGGGCTEDPSSRPSPAPAAEALLTMAQRRDFFALRDSIAGHDRDSTPMMLFARSLVAHAFNQLAESNQHVGRARRAGGLSDSLVMVLGALEVTNNLRMFRYRDGLAAAEALLGAPPPGADSAAVADVANLGKILRALVEVPPQTAEPGDSTTLRLERGLIPVRVQGRARQYIFDTGANLSTLSRSEAVSLGLRILPAGIDVGSATDIRNQADLAVADSITVGQTRLRHVVFLVFDDRLLTFPGMTIRGIIGFPVIEALGEVALRANGTITIRGAATGRSSHNLALSGHTPLTRIRWRGESALCRLDTGATDTEFYQPFYRRYQRWLDSAGVRDTATSGGVGGLRRFEVRRVDNVPVEVGDTVHNFPSISVLTTSIVRAEADNFLDCNIGHDVFDAYTEYLLDFRAMRFALR